MAHLSGGDDDQDAPETTPTHASATEAAAAAMQGVPINQDGVVVVGASSTGAGAPTTNVGGAWLQTYQQLQAQPQQQQQHQPVHTLALVGSLPVAPATSAVVIGLSPEVQAFEAQRLQDAHQTDRVYGEAGASAAAAVFDDVPLSAESHGGDVFPVSTYDTDHATANIDRATAARTRLHEQRYKSWWWRTIRFVGMLLLSRHWTEVHDEEKHPRFIVFIGANWKRWVKRLMFVAGILWWVHWFFLWVLTPDTVVLHDGSIVGNLWRPVRVKTYDLTNAEVATWVSDHRLLVRTVRPNAEYVTAHVFEDAASHNVTMEWLDDALERACLGKLDNVIRTRQPDPCVCIPAVEIGILADVVYVDGEMLFNVRISDTSSVTTRVKFDDKTESDMPITILVDFTQRDGKLARRVLEMQAAFCVMRSASLLLA